MDYYLIVVILLVLLAATDLVVGVSNDAVNFLNSAIGSHVSSRRIILIVASIGVFIGASFSSGMMEIARKGIFNPQFFTFAEVMVIFLAVMLTDIILLDLFNTFGLPTSTTVSVVFELLGASTAVALFKLSQAGSSIGDLSIYINSANALAIISGIFISVGVAFVVGTIIQFISRLLFTFHYESRMGLLTHLWASLALALLSYFLLIKGAKGASFIPDSIIAWIQGHTLMLLGFAVIGWTLLLVIIRQVFKMNILRLVVLFGTFALAMAFASNDLVNFIGVPIAGLESYLSWSHSPVDPDTLLMTSLQQPVRTKPILLIIGGLIMVLTLWFSRKARSVTETEVNLGRQGSGEERFEPIALAQWMVRWVLQIGDVLSSLMPKSLLKWFDASFNPRNPENLNNETPAFDLVRASVNLTVASTLISFATSLKLPLSTTYVSFMVAMGSSLADRAWGRNSAVFRITGVIQVISGWLMTALIAFTVAAIFGGLILAFHLWAIIPLALVATLLLIRTYRFHHDQDELKQKQKVERHKRKMSSAQERLRRDRIAVIPFLQTIKSTCHDAIGAVLKEDHDQMKKTRKKLKRFRKQQDKFRHEIFQSANRVQGEDLRVARIALLKFDLEQDMLQSETFIVKACSSHLSNSMPPLNTRQQESLNKFLQEFNRYLNGLMKHFQPDSKTNVFNLREEKKRIQQLLQDQLDQQMQSFSEESEEHATILYLSLILELKDLVAVAARFTQLFDQKPDGIKSGTSFP
ncbi:MAG: inorganic phosphate transporter [Saprospiraceae bacterium]|nr:inorganic phosphate transporter [Saprospiraceae bacterium]MCB9320981.1 inorganic phosphate transporter [Lewinellaceae bacterium]